jgi:hypothetical protein
LDTKWEFCSLIQEITKPHFSFTGIPERNAVSQHWQGAAILRQWAPTNEEYLNVRGPPGRLVLTPVDGSKAGFQNVFYFNYN